MHRTHTGPGAIPTLLIAALTLGLPVIVQSAEPNHANSHPVRCDSAYKKKPVPAKELRTIVQSHGQWLEQREKPEYRRADLCQADLRQAKLADADLERAKLDGAILRQANLFQSNLEQANLAGADLTEAVLEESNLSGADLRHARLSNANLLRAIGDEAALYDATLTGAQLRESTFERAHFEGADLSSANLTNATFVDTFFYGANLHRAICERMASFTAANSTNVPSDVSAVEQTSSTFARAPLVTNRWMVGVATSTDNRLRTKS